MTSSRSRSPETGPSAKLTRWAHDHPAGGVRERDLRGLSATVGLVLLAAACTDTSTPDRVCEPGEIRCVGTTAMRCLTGGQGYTVSDDCNNYGKICITNKGCLFCDPDALSCSGQDVVRCNSAGSAYLTTPVRTCDTAKGEICESSQCFNACKLSNSNRSYMGCEYWAVDLDNAVVESGSAAAQQFAVVLSNPSSLAASVTVTINEAALGQTVKPKQVKTSTIKPGGLEVLLLPAREVDGSPAGTFNKGGGTALSSNAYRIESTAPLIAYQFNPLSNVGVFSNDASLLVPTPALTTDASNLVGAAYLVMAWPQTIATTTNPKTNFGDDLRAFLTIVGTREKTKVKVTLSTDIIADKEGRIAAAKKGSTLLVELGPYDVLNLETGDFGADFTGTRVDADQPVAVFSGSEASDVPDFPDLTKRKCCADHLEQQLFPITTLGTVFIALTTPSRTEALAKAGAQITVNKKEREYFRILSNGENTQVTTNLASPALFSVKRGAYQQLTVDQDFTIQTTEPVVVGQFVAGQDDAAVPSSLPGGDPSFILLPPVEQFRKDYLFLTPDKYSFDFVMIAAPKGAKVLLDGRQLQAGCDAASGQKLCCTVSSVGKVRKPAEVGYTEFEAIKCQLSFPLVQLGRVPPDNLLAGDQNDGVHRLTANQPVGLIVYGFDAYVSYGYPGGLDLALINLK